MQWFYIVYCHFPLTIKSSMQAGKEDNGQSKEPAMQLKPSTHEGVHLTQNSLISEIPDNCDPIFKIPEGSISFVYIIIYQGDR
jgi:hypothetical protein